MDRERERGERRRRSRRGGEVHRVAGGGGGRGTARVVLAGGGCDGPLGWPDGVGVGFSRVEVGGLAREERVGR